MAEKPDLDGAYALETPEDSVRLYREWAETYDEDFAARRGYVYADAVAVRFAALAGAEDGPVLDVGCGTGLLGAGLAARGGWAIDGLDISAEMLAVARRKGVYRRLATGDLTGRLDLADAAYGAVVSAGTFTHGHVGPEALDELLRVARPKALFVLGINEQHYETRGFAAALEGFRKAGAISEPELMRTRIYAEGAAVEDGHGQDHALIVNFRRA